MTFPSLTKAFFVTTIASLVSTTSFANIAPFSANYNFSIENKYKGTATRKLVQLPTANQYTYAMNASVGKIASANQSAYFVNQNGSVTPLSSDTQYKVFGTGRLSKFNFYPSKKQYISTYKGKAKTIAMPQTVYDDLSLEIQIREDLKAGKFRGSYIMADRDGSESVAFTKSAITKVTVPAGTFEVVKVDRVHDDKDRQTSFWLAPKLDYLPVKVVQTNDGKKIEMNLTKVN